MYKVILIDDEEIIVEGLKQVIDWTAYNSEVVATANNAHSGILAIREYQPDIIFTDIKMPNMDGLAMVAALKSEFPQMQICVLTGFREFEYAQRALHLGVTRFLLKPSKMMEIEEALTAMVKTLQENIANDFSLKLDYKKDFGVEYTIADEDNYPAAPCKEERLVSAEKNDFSLEDYKSTNFVVNRALKYIESNYPNKITLKDVAEFTIVSSWHLSKILSKHTGQGFSEILNRTRIFKAQELLQNPELRIYQISEMVGFEEVTHFSRNFKKITSISPNEYRNQL